MAYCTQCGHELQPGVKFCTACGAPVRDTGESEAVSAKSVDKELLEAAQETIRETVSDEPDLDAVASGKSPEPPGALTPDAADEPGEDGLDLPCVSQAQPALDSVQQDCPAPAQKPAIKKRSRKPLIVLLAAVAILAAVSVGALAGKCFLPNTASGDTVVSFGSTEAVPASRTSVVIPKAQGGTPMTRYLVYVTKAETSDGEPIDISTLEPLEVSDDQGFTPNDLIADLPDGTYHFQIETDEGTRDLPPIEVSSENDKGDVNPNIEVDVADDSPDPVPVTKGADQLFLDLINEYVEKYGEPKVATKEIGPEDGSDTHYLSYVTGLAYAGLVDFGDGTERLVLAYMTGDGSSDSNYNIEVWQYDAETDSISCVLGQDGSFHPDGEFNAGLTLMDLKGNNGLIYISSEYYGEGEQFGSTETYYGLSDTGAVETIGVFSWGPQGNFIDGVEVSEDDYASKEFGIIEGVGKAPRQSDFLYFSRTYSVDSREQAETGTSDIDLTGWSDDYYFPADLVASVSDTTSELTDRIAAARSGKSTQDTQDAQDDENLAADVTGTEVTETVAVPTFDSPMEPSTGTYDVTWGYLELSSPEHSDVLDKLNAEAKKAYDANKAANDDFDPMNGNWGDGLCEEYRSQLTGTYRNYIGTRVDEYRTQLGPHGWSEITPSIVDVSTGKEVSAWDVAGISKGALDQAAVDVIVDYVRNDPKNTYYTDIPSADISADAAELVANAQYCLVKEGISVYLPEYSMGYPYSEGAKELLVYPLDGSSKAGKNLTDEYHIL